MHRRNFIVNSSLTATAALTFNPLSVLDVFAQVDPGSGSGNDDLSISINGLFMEDYTAGDPWTPSFPSWTEPYAAQDGTTQFFNVTTPALAAAQAAATIDRVYPGKGSLTGWLKQTAKLLPDTAAGRATLFSKPVFIPGATDRLVIFRNYSIVQTYLTADGSMGEVRTATAKRASMPMVSGTIPAGSLYLPEMDIDPGPMPKGVALRDLTNLGRTIPIVTEPSAPAPFPVTRGYDAKRKVFPLKGVGPDIYRCISLEEDGTVRSLLLTMDRSDADHPVFRVREQKALAKSTNGCIHVHELTPGKVEIILFDVPGIRTIPGDYDPSGSSPATWRSLFSSSLPGFRLPYGPGMTHEIAGAFHEGASVMDIFLMVRSLSREEPDCDVWTTTRCQDGSWRQLVCVEKACQSASVFPSRGNVKLLITRNLWTNVGWRPQFEVWERNSIGYWAIDSATLPKESAQRPTSVPVYRVGLKFSKQSLGLTDEALGITASVLSVAEVNGRRTIIPGQQPLQVATDRTGSVWISLPLRERLSFPDLQISSRLFPGKLEIQLSRQIPEYLSSLQGADLTKTTKRGTTLIKDAATADQVANAIRSIVGQVPQASSVAAPPSGVKVQADIPFRWVGGSTDNQPPRNFPVPSPGSSPAWSLDRGTGRFVALTTAAARALIKDEVNRLVFTVVPGSIPNITSNKWLFEDEVNWVGGRIADGAKMIGKAAVSVVSFVVDGVNLAIKMIINGAEFLYTGVMDTIHKAMDAIKCLLDFAGAKLGEAVNWILEHLGFLFDWDAIKKKRNDLRTLVENNANLITAWLPDPVAAANSVVSQLSSFRADLMAYRSLPDNSLPFASRFSLASGLPSLSSVGGSTGLPKLTWLTDKLESALPDVADDFGLPNIAGMDTAVAELSVKLPDAMNILPAAISRFNDVIGGWLSDPASFLQGAATAVVDLMLEQLDHLILLVQEIITLAAKAVDALRKQPQEIFKWLNRKISIPFFSSFYEGLTGHELTFFDVACLSAAICAQRDPEPSGGRFGVSRPVVRNESAAQEALRYFMYAGNVWNAIDAGVSARFPGTPRAQRTTALNLSCTAGAVICALIVNTQDQSAAGGQEQALTLDFIAIGAGAIAVGLYGYYNKLVVIVGQFLLIAIRMALTVKGAVERSGSAIAFNLVGMFQVSLALVVNLYLTSGTRPQPGGARIPANDVTRRRLDPKRALIHAGIQYVLGALGYNIFTGKGLINVLP